METSEVIFNRRSIRSYEDRPIADDVLTYILDAGMYAPSAVNYQPWFFVVIRSKEQRERLMKIMSQVSIRMEPSLHDRFPRNPEVVRDTTHFIRLLGGAPVCVLAFQLKPDYPKTQDTIVQSVSAAIENMLLAAWDRGIGSCWLTAPVEAEMSDELRHIFAPDKGPLMALLTFGYARQIPQMPRRKTGRYIII